MEYIELIVKIPKEKYKKIPTYPFVYTEEVDTIIRNGTPLEKHDEEVIKETVESVWGKPPYTEVLDSIRAEIENKISSDTENIVLTQKFNEGLITSIAIIDKYRKGEKK